MKLARLPDWTTRYAEFVRARHAMPFAWGENDCALFAADCVLAITGRDLAEDMRHSYSSAAGALRALEPFGHLRGLLNARVGPAAPALMARVGDACLVNLDGRDAVGICNGADIIGPGPDSLLALPLRMSVACWRVG